MLNERRTDGGACHLASACQHISLFFSIFYYFFFFAIHCYSFHLASCVDASGIYRMMHFHVILRGRLIGRGLRSIQESLF